MSLDAFQEKKAAIEAVEKMLTPNLPIAVALQEAEDLIVWCQQDKTALEGAGLSWSIVEDLPIRIEACRYIQSQWQKEFKSQEESQRQWNAMSPIAYGLHDELIHSFFYAYRNDADLLPKVQQISQGSGHADMIQDLSDLSALGKANPAPLAKIMFDMTKLDLAERQAAEMAKLLAQCNGDRRSVSATRVLRDKAYTYMRQAVDEIRQCGQYVFYRNDERKKGYTSIYKKKVSKPEARK